MGLVSQDRDELHNLLSYCIDMEKKEDMKYESMYETSPDRAMCHLGKALAYHDLVTKLTELLRE